MRAKRLVFASIFLAFATNAASQSDSDIAPFFAVKGYPHILVLADPITDRAPLSFSRALNKKPEITTIVLASPGGVLQSGLIIAEKIHERGLSTLILPDTECASACAFLFLAGKERVAAGRLGVHQASGNMDLAEAQLNLSDAIEMLDRFGVSGEVTKRMLRTPVDQMYWFSPEELVTFGINSSELSSPNAVPVPAEKPSAQFTLEQRAATFVQNWIEISTSSTYAAMAASAPYASMVMYFDKVRKKSDVMKDKQEYTERWPVRTVDLKSDTVRTSCQENVCLVTGEYLWSVFNPTTGKKLFGSAEFRYRLLIAAEISILDEGGKVLSKFGN